MSVSVVLTLYDRPQATIRRVLESLENQGQDETVVVFDRTQAYLAGLVRKMLDTGQFGRVKTPEIVGAPGWLCPARAWNLGFGHVTSDTVYCLSSETVQEPGNVMAAVKVLGERARPAVLFGAVADDGPTPLVVSDRPNVLCDSRMPRPLGFIWAAPMANVRAAGGFDEEFMAGYWFDDDDWFYRLWQTGADFLFDDSVRGVHQHHDRAELTDTGIARNQAYMMGKHGSLHPLMTVPKRVYGRPGRTVWEHPGRE